MPQLVHTLKSLSSVALLAVVKKGGPLIRRVSPEPRRLDHAAALRCGHLLILAGEIVFADRPADLLEHFGRLARDAGPRPPCGRRTAARTPPRTGAARCHQGSPA